MKALKIKVIAFTRASNGNFGNIFGEIVQALISNQSVFNQLPYSREQLEERQQQIAAKTAFAEEGSKTQKNERDLERMQCEQILLRLQGAVLRRAHQEATYEEKEAIVNRSKFTLCKRRHRVGAIIAPMPKAQMTKSLGIIFLKWKSDKNVNSWIIQHVAGTESGPSANWQTIGTVTCSKYMVTGLSAGYHSFRLVAISAAGQSAPSPAVTELAR